MPVANRPRMLGYPSKSTTQLIAVSNLGSSSTGYGSHTTDKAIEGKVSRVIISGPRKTGQSTIDTDAGFSSISISMG